MEAANVPSYTPDINDAEFAQLIDDVEASKENVDQGAEANVKTIRRYLRALAEGSTGSMSNTVVMPTKKEIDEGGFSAKPMKIDAYMKEKLNFLRENYKQKMLRFKDGDSVMDGYAEKLKVDNEGFYFVVKDQTGTEHKVRENQVIRVLEQQQSEAA